MAPIPAHCSHCRRVFGPGEDVRLAHLERGVALCDRCQYLVEHPEIAASPVAAVAPASARAQAAA